MIAEYNAAFFGLYENWFKLIKNEFGEERAIYLFGKSMEMGLSKAYGKYFKKGKTSEFGRLVGERDNSVGLLVKFPEMTDQRIIYQFYTDPFPNLKSEIAADKLDDTYIGFKVRYILGEKWHYKNTTHLWRGDECTEFVIFRS